MSAQSATADVGAFLAALPRQQRQTVKALRRLIQQAAPGTAETLLWNSLSYHQASLGGRIAGAVCLITPYPECVHLGFIHGASLADPLHLLRGSAKAKRFVPIRSVGDIEREALTALVKDAARHDPRNETVRFKTRV